MPSTTSESTGKLRMKFFGRKSNAATVLVALLAITTPTSAGIVIQPNSVTAQLPLGEFDALSAATHLIDQSGLSVGYTSGISDFDSYVLSDPTHSNASGTRWFSDSFHLFGNLDFDLGGAYEIESMALWNFGGDDPHNIIGLTLLADDNGEFSTPTVLGVYLADPNTGPYSAVLPEVFSFASTLASHVRLTIDSNNGGAQFTAGGEVAFEGIAIPEPTALTLASFALTGLACRHRKRTSQCCRIVCNSAPK